MTAQVARYCQLRFVHLLSIFMLLPTLHACTTASAPASELQLDRADAAIPVPGTDQTIEPTVVSYQGFNDPFAGFNRAMFGFNDVTYRYALIPLSEGYKSILPDPVENSISNFFHNLKLPIHAVNKLLQRKPRDSGTNIVRFLVNSTVGVAGIFDPASSWWEIEPRRTGFSQTLDSIGASPGSYLVLPFLGSTDVRGGMGTLGDFLLNPIPYILDNPASSVVQTSDYFQNATDRLLQYPDLRRQADDDPYLFFRNLYLQDRERDEQFK